MRERERVWAREGVRRWCMRKMENVYAWERQCFGSLNVGEEKREREERGRDILGV